MSAKMIRTVAEEKIKYVVYAEKARQFYETMLHARDVECWAAVGLNAVHCVISMNDALTVFYIQERSSGEDHSSAAELLARISANDSENQKANLKRIIAKKNAIAYENREFRQSEALEILKQVQRFYQWALKSLPEA
jgi:hypothetical protein